MKIKSNEIKLFFIFCINFLFILIGSVAVLTSSSNNLQPAFSQGYIPPPPNNFQSQSTQCPNIAFSGPTYKGLDGCPRPCPTANNNPNVANVYIPSECRNQAIGNQSGGTGISNPITACPNIAFSGPTYKGLDGCPRPCPTSNNIPTGCPVNPIAKGGGILIGNQSGQTQTNIPSGSCPPGIETFAACNLSGTPGQSDNDSSCQTAACTASAGGGNDRFCDLGPCTIITPKTTTTTTTCSTMPQNTTASSQSALCASTSTQHGSCPPGVQSIVACNFGKTQGQARE
jgi:hypothetical protein